MKIPIYQVDAFSSAVFGGNPAAVCPLERWLPEATMQAIAAENNLSETAFTVPRGTDFDIRWFTPVTEVDLCGHATLASGHVHLRERGGGRDAVTFHSRSGALAVRRSGTKLAMDFPARPPQRCVAPPGLCEALGRTPEEVWRARDLMAVFGSEEEIRSLAPDLASILGLGVHAVIVTAPGREVDFVSRFFAPAVGVAEDPVTGSAHCTLVPWWAARLGKERLLARQVSRRGGELACELAGDRVVMAGDAVTFLEGVISI
jgi:predicted PhzF superfamily epimerase YddE/YHI9